MWALNCLASDSNGNVDVLSIMIFHYEYNIFVAYYFTMQKLNF